MMVRSLMVSLFATILLLAGCKVAVNINTSSDTKGVSVRSSPFWSDSEKLVISNFEPMTLNDEEVLRGPWSGDLALDKSTAAVDIRQTDDQRVQHINHVYTKDMMVRESVEGKGLSATISRNAGTLEFETSPKRVATFRVTPLFASELKATYDEEPSIEKVFKAFLSNLTIADLHDYRELGEDVSFDQALEMKYNGVAGGMAQAYKAGNESFSIEDIANLHRNAVPTSYAVAVAKHRKPLSADDLIKLRRNAVPENFVTELDAAGTNFTVDEIIELRRNAVPADFVVKIREGREKLAAADYIELRRNAVPADFVSETDRMGYKFSVEEIVNLRRNAVSLDYLRDIRVEGRENLPAEAIIDLRRRAIPAETVRQLRAL